MGFVQIAILTQFLVMDPRGSKEPEYTFVPDTTRYVTVVRGNTRSIGLLDANGNFIPDRRWLHVPNNRGLSAVPATTFINRPARDPVYEYRSGRLVLGALDEQGNFLPKTGSKVIPFSEYHYTKQAIPIYNLPGRFEPVK